MSLSNLSSFFASIQVESSLPLLLFSCSPAYSLFYLKMSTEKPNLNQDSLFVSKNRTNFASLKLIHLLLLLFRAFQSAATHPRYFTLFTLFYNLFYNTTMTYLAFLHHFSSRILHPASCILHLCHI